MPSLQSVTASRTAACGDGACPLQSNAPTVRAGTSWYFIRISPPLERLVQAERTAHMRHIVPLILLGFVGFLLWGCTQQPGESPVSQSKSPLPGGGENKRAFKTEDGAFEQADQFRGKNEIAPLDKNLMVAHQVAAEAPAAVKPEVERKIIYNADVRLIVDDLTRAEQELQRFVKERKGYIASAEINGAMGSPRHGHWRLRVPADQLQSCLDAIVKLGVPDKNSTDTRDVTEEFYDLEARIKNKKVEETRLQGYLQDKKATSKLEDILVIERELNRVRGEIEQSEGRLRLLGNLSALATIDVAMQEVKDYVPPQAPTFGNKVSGTFFGSLDALKMLGEGVVLLLAALVPWLPLLAILAVPLWFVLRSLRVVHPQPMTVLPVEAPQPPPGG
jgi:hypothetical protein